MKPYYLIPKEELENGAKIPLHVLGDSNVVFSRLADEMVQVIEENNAAGKSTVMICPVGPIGHYPFFVQAVNEKRISLKHVWFINMDEYLTDDCEYIEESSHLSFRGFMNREVYGKIDPDLCMPENQRIFPDPHHPDAIGKLIDSLGGVDLAVGGIGITGHLAFNEPQPELSPEAFAALHTRVLAIAPETRTANAVGDLGGNVEDFPKLCVTIGMAEILGARKIRIGVFRGWHRAVVRRAAFGEVSAEFPVTLLQNHPDACIYVNNVAAGSLY